MTDLLGELLANPAVAAAGTAIGLAAVALWLAAAWWAHADAVRRTDSALAGYVAAGWVILSTPLMLPLSLGIYALARPQVAAGDARVRRLIEALTVSGDASSCHGCGEAVDPGWHRCPTCTTWLASPCVACGRWAEAGLELCPWCGEEARERPSIAAVEAEAATLPVHTEVAAAAAPGRPMRLARRAGVPTVPRAQRSGSRRISVGAAGSRLGRVRP